MSFSLNSTAVRVLDFFLALVLISVSAPFFILIVLIGFIDTGSPVFVQTRVGRLKREFRMFKFRTMRLGTESVPTHMADAEHVTRFGLILRRTKLDELPQLFNVLKGEMALIGPRPCLLSQNAVIRERDLRNVFEVLPGITGLAQVRGVDMSDPAKLSEMDAEMIKKFSITMYFSLLIRTVIGQGKGDRINV